jgi:hypothetical protein
VLPAVLATAAAINACGGSTPQRTASSGGGRAALKLAECMRNHGVPGFPDPVSGGGFGIQASAAGGTISVDGHQLNVSGPAFRQAMSACQKFQPTGPPLSGAQLARIKRGALKLAECMRAHGVSDFPDPRVGTGPGGRGIQVELGAPGGGGSGGQVDPRSPAFRRAATTCGTERGAFRFPAAPAARTGG